MTAQIVENIYASYIYIYISDISMKAKRLLALIHIFYTMRFNEAPICSSLFLAVKLLLPSKVNHTGMAWVADTSLGSDLALKTWPGAMGWPIPLGIKPT